MRTKFKKSAANVLLTILCFAVPAAHLFAQKFQNLYGNNLENYFSKVVPEGSNYYVVGNEDNYGTVTHVLNNGQIDWTIRFIAPCLLLDAVPVFTGVGQPPNLMVVGLTLPFDNTNKSLLAVVTPTGGLAYTRQYDFPGNEGFVRVAQSTAGTYAVVGYVNNPVAANNVLLLNVSGNGALNAANLYGNNADNGYFYDVEIFGVDQLLAGYDGNAGVIFRLDNSLPVPNYVAGVRDPSVARFDDLAVDGADVIAVGSPANPGGAPLIRRFDANLFPIWTAQITTLDAVRQVEVSPANGDIYVVGEKIVGGIGRTVILRIDDSSGTPVPVWARYLDNGENAHATGFITLLASGDIALADGKTGISNGFGQGDAFMAVTNADLNSYCAKNLSVALVPDNPFLESPELDHLDFTNLNPVSPLDYNAIAWQKAGVCFDPTPIISCGNVRTFVEPEYGERRVGFDWELAQNGFTSLEYSPPSGSVFPLGTTLVTATATDAAGTTSTCTFNVVVEKLPYDTLQPPLLATPEGWFDRLRDQYGNPYRLGDLQVPDPTRGTPLCANSGYFNLYFEPGSGMEGNTPLEVARRDVLCQVFSDISQFISQPNPANPAKVNIWVRNLGLVPSVPNPQTSSVLGVGGVFFAMPAGAPAKGGIVDNEIWKTINSGVDSYTGMVSPLTVQMGGGFYHGFVAFNFANPSVMWHTDLPNLTGANLYDLYTVALHEVTHALGFASLVVPANNTGESFFAPGYPRYFSRYDAFLKSPPSLGSQPLITNPGACSPAYDFDFNPGLANTGVLAPNPSSQPCDPDNTICSDAIQFVSSSVNQAVFTPNCFYDGSSLSHFEDECRAPVTQPNNQYYVMSNMTGPGQVFMKRYLKPEEREVLCQLGYQVGSQYGNPVQHTFFDYQTGACNLLGVAGVNDGIGPNGSFLYAVAPGGTTNTIFPLANDFGAVAFECLEPVFGTGIPSATAGTSFTYAAPATPGLNLLRYVPLSANGKRGNITYILIYVQVPGCPADACSLAPNGGFEASTGCGGFYPQNLAPDAPSIDCWASLAASPDLFTRSCASPGVQVGVSTFNSLPPSDSHNGAPNDKFMGFVRSDAFPQAFSEAAQARLTTPLLPGETYTLSFWAKTNNNINGPSSNLPARIEFASDAVFPLAHVLKYLPGTVFQPLFPDVVVPNDNQWHFFSKTFTFNGTVPHANLIVAYGGLSFPPGSSSAYFFLDDVELKKTPTPFSFDLPPTRCLNDLQLLLNTTVTVPGGIFAGPGVIPSGTNYLFDAQLAGLGTHGITYSFTDANGCKFSFTDSIAVDSCFCACASDAASLYNGDTSYVIFCNTHGAQDPLLGCPVKDLIISGFFGCTDTSSGELCEERDVWWELTHNGTTIDFGTTGSYPVFFFPATLVKSPGVYILTRQTVCPGSADTCVCNIRWVQLPCDTCCTDYAVFSQAAENAISIVPDNALHKVTVHIGDLPACDSIAWIIWGDGQTDSGPFGGNTMVMHAYAANGTYNIQLLAQEFNTQVQPPQLCFDVSLSDTSSVRTPVKYVISSTVCSAVTPALLGQVVLTWDVYYKCVDAGGRINAGGSPFRLEKAVLQPNSLPSPAVALTDQQGNPVLDAAGVEVVLTASSAVAAKVQNLYPAPAGYQWYGLQSNLLIPSGSPAPDSQDFRIVFTWVDLPPGSENSTGAFWASDDKDDLYGELITDAYTELDSALLIVPVGEPYRNSSIRLFPNPANGSLTLEFTDGAPRDGLVQILDIYGRLLGSERFSDGRRTRHLSVAMLPAGMYVVRVTAEGRMLAVERFVKQ